MGFPIDVVYTTLGIVAMLILLYSPFEDILKHGRSVPRTNSIWYLSKNNFKYFYLVGVLCGIYTIIKVDLNMLRMVFLGHLIRRYFESAYLFHSSTQMHALHLSIGYSYYPIVWLVLSNPISKEANNFSLTLAFLALNYLQFKSHLAMSRNTDKSKLPASWLFYSIICPNFLCEVLLYVVVAVWIRNPSATLLVVFVGMNQVISALDRLKCYPKYAKLGWKAIIPYLL